MKIEFKKLSKDIDASQFDCGEEDLNRFLNNRALNEQKQRVSSTIVAFTDSLVGFYSICPTEISKEEPPKKIGRGVTYRKVGGWRIGRLAADRKSQGKGIGEKLLIHALLKCLEASELFGGRFVVVDAKHEKAASFYQRYGFRSIQDDPLTLIIKISDIEKSFGIV